MGIIVAIKVLLNLVALRMGKPHKPGAKLSAMRTQIATSSYGDGTPVAIIVVRGSKRAINIVRTSMVMGQRCSENRCQYSLQLRLQHQHRAQHPLQLQHQHRPQQTLQLKHRWKLQKTAAATSIATAHLKVVKSFACRKN